LPQKLLPEQPQLPQSFLQIPLHLLAFCAGGGSSGDQNQIKPRLNPIFNRGKSRPENSFGAVSLHRAADLLPGGDPKTHRFQMIFARIHHEQVGRLTAPPIIQPPEFLIQLESTGFIHSGFLSAAIPKSGLPADKLPSPVDGAPILSGGRLTLTRLFGLVGQLLASLCAATGKNLPAVFGGHSRSEAMNLASLVLGGLISSQHDDYLH